MTGLFWITLLAFTLSVAFCLGFRGLAREWHLIDIPDARKRHDGNVPLCGGIAIFLSFLTAVWLTPAMTMGAATAMTLLPGLFLILVTGVLDDRFSLPVTPRFAIQLLSAFLIIGLTGVTQIHLSLTPAQTETAFGDILNGPLFLALALTFIVGLVNAVNMSDGVDGLAGSASAAAFFWLAIISFSIGENRLGIQIFALAGACLGFLVFNMRHRWRTKASLFLGDGGSTLLGAALAGIILILASAQTVIAFPILIWIVIVPVVDTLSLIVRRLAARRSPFSPDRQHLHHLLLDNGLSTGQTTFVVMMLNFSAGAIGFAAIHLKLPVWPMLLALILPAIAHSLFVLRTNKGLRTNITIPGATL